MGSTERSNPTSPLNPLPHGEGFLFCLLPTFFSQAAVFTPTSRNKTAVNALPSPFEALDGTLTPPKSTGLKRAILRHPMGAGNRKYRPGVYWLQKTQSQTPLA